MTAHEAALLLADVVVTFCLCSAAYFHGRSSR